MIDDDRSLNASPDDAFARFMRGLGYVHAGGGTWLSASLVAALDERQAKEQP